MQVRTYLLLRSILWQLAAIAEGLRPDGDEDSIASTTARGRASSAGSSKESKSKLPPVTDAAASGWGPRDILVAGLCTLRLLRANMYHLRAAGVSPGAVGLGTSSGPSSGAGGRREKGGSGAEQRSPFAAGLLTLLLDYAGGVLDVIPPATYDDDDEEANVTSSSAGRSVVAEDGDEMSALRRAVRYEAAEIVGRGLEIFLPEARDRTALLSALFRQACGGDGDGIFDGEFGETKEEEQQESKTRDGRNIAGATAVAAAAAMADGPLPVEMDEEGCSALLSGVCGAICSDPDLLLSLVPEIVRPPLTVRDVPSYVASKVRSAEKAHAQALQTRLLKEAAAATSSLSPGGAEGASPNLSSSPRLGASSRTRAGEGDDGEGSGLWKSGQTAGLPRAGDVVVRGPDWVWDEQDGEPGGRGLVVGLGTWGRARMRGDGSDGDSVEDRNAVRVMWQKGTINVYRWGAVGLSPLSPATPSSSTSDDGGRSCYDLKVLRPPVATQGDDGRSVAARIGDGTSSVSGGMGASGGDKGHPGSKSHAVRGELKWSAEDVEDALLKTLGGGDKDKRGGRGGGGDDSDAPTTREVLRFIKNNAPQEWREPRRITGAENALVKVSEQAAKHSLHVLCRVVRMVGLIFEGHILRSFFRPWPI